MKVSEMVRTVVDVLILIEGLAGGGHELEMFPGERERALRNVRSHGDASFISATWIGWPTLAFLGAGGGGPDGAFGETVADV